MLWPFNHFKKPRLLPRGTIETIYGMIVTQAREPEFYRKFAVADTVNGRFDLLLMHLWLVLRRLRAVEGESGLSQALFDRFCEDMDDNLREMGVGDLTVPKRMKAFEAEIPGLVELRDRVAERPNIKAYLASKRRIPFNEQGIFRRYKELDG